MKRKTSEKGVENWVGKCRIVVCGNLQPKSGEEEEKFALSTQQVDATTVRVVLRLAAYWSWDIGLLDVKTAFLNAAMEEGEVALRRTGQRRKRRRWNSH